MDFRAAGHQGQARHGILIDKTVSRCGIGDELCGRQNAGRPATPDGSPCSPKRSCPRQLFLIHIKLRH